MLSRMTPRLLTRGEGLPEDLSMVMEGMVRFCQGGFGASQENLGFIVVKGVLHRFALSFV